MKFIISKLSPEHYEEFPQLEKNDLRKGEYLDDIMIAPEERGKGLATSKINQWVENANNKNIFLFLQAYPYESQKSFSEYEKVQKKLIQFYKEFGFIEECDGWMFRPPMSRSDEFEEESY